MSRAWNHKSPLEASANRHRSASTPEIINSIICSPRFHTYTTGSHTHDHLWLLSACKFRRYILQDYTRAPESWRCSQRQICGCRHDRVFSSPSSIFRECSFIATCTASIRIRNANVPLHFLRKFNLHGFVPPLRTMILRRRRFAS